jgi:hypothetical protein
MKSISAMKVVKPTRSVEWTKDRIEALATPEIKQLRANAERLNDPDVKERCDDVLSERPRSGVPRRTPAKKAPKVVAAAAKAGTEA